MINFDQRWAKVEQIYVDRFQKKPNMEAILFLIGINELGAFPQNKNFTKEQKQDLMHIAVCKLLSQYGIYEFEKYDEEGWPHYKATGLIPPSTLADQEQLLKEAVIDYFDC